MAVKTWEAIYYILEKAIGDRNITMVDTETV
jgi:hypothetical protein